jgi:hypothetical protein
MLTQGIFGIVAKRGRSSMKLIQYKRGRSSMRRRNAIQDQYRKYYERGSSTAEIQEIL